MPVAAPKTEKVLDLANTQSSGTIHTQAKARRLSCERSSLAKLAEECDQTVEVWPHWMRCSLNWLLHDLKSAVQDQASIRVHHRGIVLDYFYGSGSTYSEYRTAAVREAMEIMDLNTRTFYIWIENELCDLDDWPRKVYSRMDAAED